MKNNKGVITQQFALMVILVIAAIVLLSTTIGFVTIFKAKSDIEVCRLSVLAQAQTKKFGPIDLPSSIISLDCPRRHVEFFNNKVEIDGKKSKDYKFGELKEENVNKVIADELASCWYKMGEGIINVFEQEVIVGRDYVCLICAEKDFDKKTEKTNFKNLVSFLKNN